MSTLVIARYHCVIAGKMTNDVDYRVRYFTTDDENEVLCRLKDEEPTSYQNSSGETVHWIFDDTEAFSHDPNFNDGNEIIGFITRMPKETAEPQSSSSPAETLKRTIMQAFANVPFPPKDRIANCSRPECDECAGIRWGLQGRTHDLILPYFPYILEYHHAALPLLFPEAFHYFVPMYMCYSVEQPDSEVAFFTRQSLGENGYDEFYLKRYCLFTVQQREAVIAFLEFLKEQKIEGDDQDQREYEEKLNDAVWIWKDLRRFPSLAGMSDDQMRELYQEQRKMVQSTTAFLSAPTRHPTAEK